MFSDSYGGIALVAYFFSMNLLVAHFQVQEMSCQ